MKNKVQVLVPFFFLLLFMNVAVSAQNETVTDSQPVQPAQVEQRTVASESAGVSEAFEIHMSYSQGRKLVGYTDPRYVADDKTDYLESAAMTANLELLYRLPYKVKADPDRRPIENMFAGVEYLRIGMVLNGWSIQNGSSISIPAINAPVNSDAVEAELKSEFRPGLGFFIGYGKITSELDFGLTLMPSFETEGSRTRRIVDTNGNLTGETEEVPGRGTFITNWYVVPTFKWVYGRKRTLQFIASAGRGTYEFNRDYLQTYFRIPMWHFLSIETGIGLYPTATLFLQPNLHFGDFLLGLRGGITMNYYEDELKRVSITDTLYFALTLSAKF